MHVVQHDGAATRWTCVVRSNVDKAFCDLGGGGMAWPLQSPEMALCDFLFCDNCQVSFMRRLWKQEDLVS